MIQQEASVHLRALAGEIAALDERRERLVSARRSALKRARAVGVSWDELIEASGLSRGMVQRELKR